MSWRQVEQFWQVNLVQIGAIGCVLGLAVVLLAIRPVGSAARDTMSGRESLRIPQAAVLPDLDQALARLVADSFTPGRADNRTRAVTPRQRKTKPVNQVVPNRRRLTPPPRPLAVNMLGKGSPEAYYPNGDNSGKLIVRRRGENVGRWTIIDISQSCIRYRNGSQEHRDSLFGGNDGGGC